MLSQSLQFCEYCIPSLTRLRNVLVYRLSLTSVSQMVSLQIILCNLCVYFDSSESVANALFEPALLLSVISYNRFDDALFEPTSVRVCVCVKHLLICLRSLRTGTFICVCVFAVARSEPASVVYTCLLTLFLSQHLLSTHRRYLSFAPKVTVFNLDSLHQTILFALQYFHGLLYCKPSVSLPSALSSEFHQTAEMCDT